MYTLGEGKVWPCVQSRAAGQGSVQEGAEAAFAVPPELVVLDGHEHLLGQQGVVGLGDPRPFGPAPLQTPLFGGRGGQLPLDGVVALGELRGNAASPAGGAGLRRTLLRGNRRRSALPLAALWDLHVPVLCLICNTRNTVSACNHMLLKQVRLNSQGPSVHAYILGGFKMQNSSLFPVGRVVSTKAMQGFAVIRRFQAELS